jgi:hypothetical protein
MFLPSVLVEGTVAKVSREGYFSGSFLRRRGWLRGKEGINWFEMTCLGH